MFELFTPRNPIVVKPDRETIVLHGVRDNETYMEVHNNNLKRMNRKKLRITDDALERITGKSLWDFPVQVHHL